MNDSIQASLRVAVNELKALLAPMFGIHNPGLWVSKDGHTEVQLGADIPTDYRGLRVHYVGYSTRSPSKVTNKLFRREDIWEMDGGNEKNAQLLVLCEDYLVRKLWVLNPAHPQQATIGAESLDLVRNRLRDFVQNQHTIGRKTLKKGKRKR